jgi:glycosyltransferase involved in cell wall biosynthesis
MNKSDIIISTVLLNWNRINNLHKTINSYLKTIDVDYELIIVDNNSADGSQELIKSVCAGKSNHHAILLDKNIGGSALNIGADKTVGRYIHFSENDIEYLPGWRADMLSKFDIFSELGQLSPFSPLPQKELGEIFSDKSQQVVPLTRYGVTVYSAFTNCGTTSIIRREIWDLGIQWKSCGAGDIWFPDDGAFSEDIKKMGYIVAYNEKYVVINWGHNINEFTRDIAYYADGYKAKLWFGIEGFKARLKDHGYLLLSEENDNAGYRIIADKKNNSVIWRIARRFHKLIDTILPLGTRRRMLARRIFYWFSR